MSSHTITHSIKSEIKENLNISIPLIASQMIYACSGFIGTAMVARLGQDALAASVLVSMIWFCISVLFFGSLNSISVLISHQFGARNYAAISEITGQAFLLGILLIVAIILCMGSMPFILHLSSQPQAVLTIAHQYVFALLFTIPGLVILIIAEQFLMGINRTKMVLRISLLIVPIEIPLIYALIFGKFGLPACGVAGIGYGFAITYTATTFVLLAYLHYAKQYVPFNIFGNITKINLIYLKELIVVGLPIGFMQVMEVGAFMVATFWISQFGTMPLAAHQIAMQYLGLFITIVFAMSQAVTVRVGHAVGREDLLGVKYASYTGILLNSFIMIIICLLLYFAPEFFLRLDMNVNDPANAPLKHQAAMYLSMAGFLIVFDNFRIIGVGALRGLKDTQFPIFAAFLSFWLIGLSTAYLFAFVWHYHGEGVWVGLTTGIASGAVIVLIRMRWLIKRINLKKILAMS